MNVSIYDFYSWIGMWNRLVTLPIGNREGLDGGGEGPSYRDENVRSEWLSAEAMTVDGGVAVGL